MINTTVKQKFSDFTGTHSCDRRWVPVKGKTPVRPGTDTPLEWRRPENRYFWDQIVMIPAEGYGIILDKTGLTCIDFDKCLSDDGTITDDRIDSMVRKLDSWAEISSSGRGLHIWVITDANMPNVKPGTGFELITDGHVKVTGVSYPPTESKMIRMVDGDEIRDILGLSGQPASRTSGTRGAHPDEKIPEGARNDTLFRMAARFRYDGMSEAGIRAALLEENRVRCIPPLPDDEVIRIAGSAGNYPPGKPYSASNETKKTTASVPVTGPEPRETITPEEIEARRAAFRKAIPGFPELPAGFFRDYMDYGKRMSYAVPDYHFGTIMAVLSCAIGRKVVMISTSQRLYCNVFVMIIGQTTTSGKSTACNMGVDQFYTVIEQEGICEKLTKKNSPQSVIQRLAKIPNRLWYYDECAEFYSDITNRWAAALESILCSVYDGSEVSYGLGAGKGKVDEYKARDVFLSCLWNTTDGEIDRHANWNSFANGFLPRFMWFWNFSINTPRKNRGITDEDRAVKAGLEMKIQALRSILYKIPGNDMIQFSPSDIIEDWKIQNDLSHLSVEHEVYRIATGRLMGQAYKIAMMMALTDEEIQKAITNSVRFPLKIDIPEEHARTALKIVEEYLRPRVLHVADLSESNRVKSGQDSIIKALKKHDGVTTRSKLLMNTRIRSKRMDELLSTMEEAEMITVKTEASQGKKPVMVVMLNV